MRGQEEHIITYHWNVFLCVFEWWMCNSTQHTNDTCTRKRAFLCTFLPQQRIYAPIARMLPAARWSAFLLGLRNVAVAPSCRLLRNHAQLNVLEWLQLSRLHLIGGNVMIRCSIPPFAEHCRPQTAQVEAIRGDSEECHQYESGNRVQRISHRFRIGLLGGMRIGRVFRINRHVQRYRFGAAVLAAALGGVRLCGCRRVCHRFARCRCVRFGRDGRLNDGRDSVVFPWRWCRRYCVVMRTVLGVVG